MVSIKDVANQAGVAISTVSKVLNHYPNVSEKTKQKVNKAIEELVFVPNMAASILSSNQAGRIALLINPNMQTQAVDEINMQYIAGALSKAKELRMDIITVFFSMIRDMSVTEITNYFRSQNIAGLIICGMDKKSAMLHKLIDAQAFKIVVIDAPIFNQYTSSIWIDNEQAQYDIALKTATENKCKSILYIAGKRDSYVAGERQKAIERLAREKQMKLVVKFGEFSELAARKITFQYAKKLDMVACASDLMAIGAMKALMEMDIFRPVCGFDGITLMGYVGQQMNTVKQNFSYISAQAVIELGKLLSGDAGRNIVLPYELVRMEYEDIIR